MAAARGGRLSRAGLGARRRAAFFPRRKRQTCGGDSRAKVRPVEDSQEKDRMSSSPSTAAPSSPTPPPRSPASTPSSSAHSTWTPLPPHPPTRTPSGPMVAATALEGISNMRQCYSSSKTDAAACSQLAKWFGSTAPLAGCAPTTSGTRELKHTRLWEASPAWRFERIAIPEYTGEEARYNGSLEHPGG